MLVLGMVVMLVLGMVVMLVLGMVVMSFAFVVWNGVYSICRNDALPLEVSGFNQPVKPPFKLKAVDNKELRHAHCLCRSRRRSIHMGITIRSNECSDGDMLTTDPLYHVAKY